MDDIQVIILNDGDPIPPDVTMAPDIEEMEPEAAVRYLMAEWGMDEADARFEVALVRGETDGDAYAVDDDGQRVRSPRHQQAPA